MFYFTVGEYTICLQSDGLPSLFNEYSKRAALAEHIDLSESEGNTCYLSVAKQNMFAFLVVAQRYCPGLVGGFYPGALLVPETNILFIGAGERLLAYDLIEPKRIWEDTADVGFWGWCRHGDVIIMLAELECAAWDIKGKKLWTTFVEPPWDYSVSGEMLHLDVMGKKTSFPLDKGPQ